MRRHSVDFLLKYVVNTDATFGAKLEVAVGPVEKRSIPEGAERVVHAGMFNRSVCMIGLEIPQQG